MSKATSVRTDTLTAPWQRLIDEFIDAQHKLGRSADMQRQHRHRLTLFAEYVAGEPSTVTRAEATRWLAEAPCSELERRKRAQSLRIFYRWAVTNGYASSNPTARLTSPGVSGPPPAEFPAPWAEAFEAWAMFMRSAGRPETTIHQRKAQLARLARDLDGLGPWETTTDDLIDWLASKSWVGETRRSHRTTLRSFYRWATTFQHVAIDPTINLPVIQVTRGLPRPAADHRIKFALASADSRTRLMILLAATMGLRRAEIAKLHTKDVTETGLVVWGKGSRKRLVPVPPIIVQALAGIPTGFVFPSSHAPGRPLTAKRVGRIMTEQLGDGVSPHMLRHRFATVAYSAERDIRAVQVLLGHSDIKTTMIYAEVSEASLVTAVAAAAKL